jgi:hypothetical protein
MFSRKKTDGFQKYSTVALGQMIFYWNYLYNLICDNDICLILNKTKIQDDKRVIRMRESKDKRYIGQGKKSKKTTQI